MKGLDLSKAYFDAYGEKMLSENFPEYRSSIAVGLVGEGSECLGFDDAVSQDHDFGPGFCVWLPQQVFNEVGARMQSCYDQLPKNFNGIERVPSRQAHGRVGIFSVEEFYRRYLGVTYAPKDNMEWFRVPQKYYAMATNGRVFYDNKGDFTAIRQGILEYYPRDVLLKKLAAKAVLMAQSGQYNYPRAIKRQDYCAAYLSCNEFVRYAVATIYLLNGKYMPFYKWAFRGMENLPGMGTARENLKRLISLADNYQTGPEKTAVIESISSEIGREFNRRGFTLTSNDFLEAHGEEMMRNISDARLRSLHIMADAE